MIHETKIRIEIQHPTDNIGLIIFPVPSAISVAGLTTMPHHIGAQIQVDVPDAESVARVILIMLTHSGSLLCARCKMQGRARCVAPRAITIHPSIFRVTPRAPRVIHTFHVLLDFL
jgi:hypothetical protein